MSKKPIHLKGLNGIRAIAALAVVLSHTTMALSSFGLSPYVFGRNVDGGPQTLDLAGFGVSMFFVLSGFLITFLLWKEKDKQEISVNKFYFRRILRIWPLYYLYLISCLIVYWWFDLATNMGSIWYYLFYAANVPFIFGKEMLFLGHFWSLGVEEQFYIFWPWMNKLKKNKIIRYSLLFLIILLVFKIYLHIFIPNSTLELFIHVTRFHCMIIGALGAMLYFKNHQLFLKIVVNPFSQIVAWICLLLVAINRFHIASFLDNELISFITVVLIVGQVEQKGLISLENKVFDFFGRISYGIYVIHPLVIFLWSKFFFSPTKLTWLNYISVYALVFGSTILISHLSFKYFEYPFLKLKEKKFTVIKSVASLNSK